MALLYCLEREKGNSFAKVGKEGWELSKDSAEEMSSATSRPLNSRWREIRACNDNTYGESKGQNSHESLLDLTCLIAATDPKAPIYWYLISRQRPNIALK